MIMILNACSFLTQFKSSQHEHFKKYYSHILSSKTPIHILIHSCIYLSSRQLWNLLFQSSHSTSPEAFFNFLSSLLRHLSFSSYFNPCSLCLSPLHNSRSPTQTSTKTSTGNNITLLHLTTAHSLVKSNRY